MNRKMGYQWNLRALMADRGMFATSDLVPLLAEHPRKALAMLDFHRPVLAILDLDMSKAERTGRSVEEVLDWLSARIGPADANRFAEMTGLAYHHSTSRHRPPL